MQVRVALAYDQRFASALESSDVASLRSLIKGARRGHAIADLDRHVANVMVDLMGWHRFAIPGAPLPVPYPEILAEAVRSTAQRREGLIPEILGDIGAFAYGETYGAPVDRLLLTTRIEQAPNPDSRVSLAADRDQLGLRRVRLDWRLSDVDRHQVRRTLEILGSEAGRSGLGRVKILQAEGERGWPDDLAGGWHLMGTTRMSNDPKQGVVDRNCRVHGMSNLYVAGSSVFPTAGSGTPTLTLVALALRLARHLKEMLR